MYVSLFSEIGPTTNLYSGQNGSWHLYQLESIDGKTMELNAVADPLHLVALSFIEASSPPLEEVSILSCGSSLVLLAGIIKSPTREIVLLLWDLQYSVLLASQTFSLPSQSSNDKTPIVLELVEGSASQILLLVSPSRKSLEIANALRSSILVVPVTAPPTSTIANAMGRASAGAQWLASESGTSTSVADAKPDSSSFDTAQKKLLVEMQSAVEQNRPQAANATFFEWRKRQGDAEGSNESGKVPALEQKVPLEFSMLALFLIGLRTPETLF